jgi:aminoglycoside phosphotransferase (APT) family kinase protein
MATRTPLALAALACSAVRGLEPVGARRLTSAADDVDTALVDDDLKRQWVVRAPRTASAGARLEQETTLLDTLTSWLPFALPQVAGTAALPTGGRAVVHRQLPGTPLSAGRLAADAALAAGFGRAVAAIHDLPTRLVEEVGLPTYGTEEYRFRRLAEVDRFAITGKVPHRLLTRWEQAVEEVGAWRFAPVVVHGDLVAENVLADDFAWVAVGADEGALTGALIAYADARREPPDPDLPRRARLVGELAIARWLMHGINTDDAVIVDDAVDMLAELDHVVDGLPW